MAGEEHVRDAGMRLAADLRDLRSERGIDADAILEATRLSADIFEAFEQSALVDHPAFNRVYLRSIVSTYARVLQIDEGDVLAGLEQALEGRYHGSLRQKYLERYEPGSGPSFTLLKEDSGREKSPDTTEEPVQETAPKIDQLDQTTDAFPGSSFRKRVVWVSILGTVAVVILAWIVSRSSGDRSDESAVIETSGQILAPEPVGSTEPDWILLGDSIRFDIVASGETLDPIRVTRDEDIRRPYWIEHQDTLTFYVRNRIIFERELDVADILMDGYLLSDSLIDASGRLIMTRDRARAWLDSLAVRQAGAH